MVWYLVVCSTIFCWKKLNSEQHSSTVWCHLCMTHWFLALWVPSHAKSRPFPGVLATGAEAASSFPFWRCVCMFCWPLNLFKSLLMHYKIPFWDPRVLATALLIHWSCIVFSVLESSPALCVHGSLLLLRLFPHLLTHRASNTRQSKPSCITTPFNRPYITPHGILLCTSGNILAPARTRLEIPDTEYIHVLPNPLMAHHIFPSLTQWH